MPHSLKCWRCGAALEDLSLPLARLDECPECLAELHICKMCSYYDPAVTKACREDDAEEVKEKQRANFCDYFKPSPDAFVPGFKAATAGAHTQLSNLFGDDPPPDDSGNDDPEGADGGKQPDQALEDLFKT